jgi:hypothetical protein
MRITKPADFTRTVSLVLACLLCLVWFRPGVAGARPYLISADGAEVTDQRSGLIWRRCVEGMNWDGATCTGNPGDYTHGQALQQAAAQAAATGKGWRLPNTRELSNLGDIIGDLPAADPSTFPTTPTGWFWSDSANTGYLNYAWYLDLLTGYLNLGYDWYTLLINDSVHGYNRNLSKYVRLVRDGR